MQYSQELADKVCELIMDGLSLRKIEAMEGMPRRLTILKWLRETPEFQTQYAHAREEQAEALAEEIVSISDEADVRLRENEDGEMTLQLDSTAIARNRLRVDARKWTASKLKPKKYGDSTQIKLADANGDRFSLSDILGSLDGQSADLPTD